MSRDRFQVGEAEICLAQGDITDMDTDAIVNAANSTLMGGGGVDGAIHRRGGPKILEECRRIRATMWPDGLPTGKAVATSGGDLRVRYVIHMVGPIWHGGDRGEPALLAEAYRNCLKLATSMGLKRIAFPSISTGAYGYPIKEASRMAISTVKEFLEREDKLERVILVLFTKLDLEVYREAAQEII